MDITLLPPTAILANHSHLSLLPSALPRNPNTRRPCHVSTDQFNSFCSHRHHKMKYEPRAPPNGRSPISSLPDEVLLSVFSWLDFEDLLAIRQSSRRLSALAIAPALHRSLTLSTLPPKPFPTLLTRYLLPPIRHLHLHLFPYPLRPPSSSSSPSSLLLSLIHRIPPDQLISLSLPFSAPYLSPDDLCHALSQVGQRLQRLDLRGSALAGERWIKTFAHMSHLTEVDLGFTNISALPAFQGLQSLSLASCPSLPASALEDFLLNLPSTLRRIDLSRLDQISFNGLWDMKVVSEVDGIVRPTELREIKVVGIDHLTRRDVRSLKKHWENQRRSLLPSSTPTVDAGAKPLPIPKQRYATISRSSETRHTYLLSPPHTPRSVGAASPSSSGSYRLSGYTPATSVGSSLGSPPIQSPSPIAHRHPFLSSLSGLPTPPPSVPPLTSPCEANDGRTDGQGPDLVSVNIIHSAILESEDEDGYRRFIGEVAGAIVEPDWGRGEVEEDGYVEIDL